MCSVQGVHGIGFAVCWVQGVYGFGRVKFTACGIQCV